MFQSIQNDCRRNFNTTEQTQILGEATEEQKAARPKRTYGKKNIAAAAKQLAAEEEKKEDDEAITRKMSNSDIRLLDSD